MRLLALFIASAMALHSGAGEVGCSSSTNERPGSCGHLNLHHPRTKRSVEVIRNLFQPSLGVDYSIPGILSPEMCQACEHIVGMLLQLVDANTDQEIQLMLYNLCVAMDIMAEPICKGITDIFTPELSYILRHADVEADTFCAVALQRFGCSAANASDWRLEDEDGDEWEVEKDGFGADRRLPPLPLRPDEAPLKVLHLTDFHLQPEYVVGGNAACGSYLCCRPEQGTPREKQEQAGRWGDYRDCDLPYHSLDNLLRHASLQHPDVSLVLMTGDLPPHAVWDTSRESNAAIIRNVTSLMHRYFPHVPVFPVLGNHETHPVNCYPPQTVQDQSMGSSWLFEEWSEAWSRWLPAGAQESLRTRGYYSAQAGPRLRVIALNNNVAYVYNWWLVYDFLAPRQQLRWLFGELRHAEAAGERVLLLGHVPPGADNLWHVWSKQFSRIVARFRDTVVAQWYGHTHTDEFRLFFHPDDPRTAVNVAFVGGSATTYSYLNPNYKVFHLHPHTSEVLDHETWYYNLTEANVGDEPTWRLLYSARDAFGLDSLHPQQMSKLVSKFTRDRTLLDKYHRFYVKDSDPLLVNECENQCRRYLMCYMRLSDSGDLSHCRGIIKEMEIMDAFGDMDVYVTESSNNDLDSSPKTQPQPSKPRDPDQQEDNALQDRSSLRKQTSGAPVSLSSKVLLAILFSWSFL